MMLYIVHAWGLSGAASTLVGQNLGANAPERATQSVMKTVKYNIIFMLLVSLIFFSMGEWLVGFFSEVESVRSIASKAMYIMASGFVFYGIGMVMVNAFNGAGDTWTPTWINFFAFWTFQVPVAYLLAVYFEMGPTGVFVAIPIAETGVTIASYILFRKGKWKQKQV